MNQSRSIQFILGLMALALVIELGIRRPVSADPQPELVKQASIQQHMVGFDEYSASIRASLEQASPALTANSSQPLLGGIVSHHLPTAIPLLAAFFAQIGSSSPPEHIVILGPNHRDRSGEKFASSEGDFVTAFGTVATDRAVIDRLKNNQLFTIDEDALDKEHSIGTQLL